MSKQLTSEQWKHLFKIFEQNQKLCWIELSKLKRVTKDTKKWFRKKYKKFICHNQDMNTLISMTGKAPKKCKGTGRPRKNQTKHEIWKELIRDIGEDEVARIFRELIEEGDDKAGEKIKQIINKTKLSSLKLASILNISKSKICYLRNGVMRIGHLNRKNE